MAEAVVSIAIERISNLLIQEAAFLNEVRDEVQRLQAELKRMRCFLRDADQRQQQDERIHNLVAEIRDVAYLSEDVIDRFVLEFAQTRSGCSSRFLQKLASIFWKPRYLHKIGVEVQSIWSNLEDISKSLGTYDIKFVQEGEGTSARSEMQRRTRRTYPHAGNEYVFGLEDGKEDVIAELMKVEERRRVVSIVGMGGSGKTTLAKIVYNDTRVKNHFDCCAWAFISQQYSTRDVLLGIRADVKYIITDDDYVKRVRKESEPNSEEYLVKTLHEFLKTRRYLIVLDDIWRVGAWDGLKNAFPDEGMGSKVLFTTRNKDIAIHADPWSSPIEPSLLKEMHGWKLFCRKAFPTENVGGSVFCPPEFEQSGQEMVKRCQGLPLAIVVLGGLLATKKSLREWEAVQRDMSSHLKTFERIQEYGGVFGILALSYYDLPYYLKPCFLYLGHFPEDWAFPKGKLIRLWIAEGFVDPEFSGFGEETMEDIAEGYFEQLVSRCMVQVWASDSSSGSGAKICRTHDLMRDLSTSKAREESFLGIVESPKNSPYGVKVLAATNSRRIAFHHTSHVDLVRDYHKVRSLLFFSPQPGNRKKIGECRNWRLLRVLDLQGFRFEDATLGEEVGNFLHLRYLCLRNCNLENLPASLGKLQGLYTLDLRGNPCQLLPNVIWRMKLLRHLLVDRWLQTEYIRLDTLTNLQRVKDISANSTISRDGLFKMTNLQHLGISFKFQQEIGIVFQSLELERLCSLKMEFRSMFGAEGQTLEPLSRCRSLVKLQLYGEINEDPLPSHQLKFLPQNLSKLTLKYARLRRDPMSMLEKLPSLRNLDLWYETYIGVEMVCSTKGFPQLEFLKLSWLTKVEMWIVEEAALPRLRKLSIDNLTRLQMIPTGLSFVHSLQELIVSGMSLDFKRRLDREGQDYDSIAHIPKITYN